MSAGHSHGSSEIQFEKPLWWALGLTSTFMLAEIAGGLLTNSLALLADAAHMATDAIALAISLVAVRISRRPPDAKRTYGYARMEALGAMINGAMLFGVAGYILWEAFGRFSEPPAVASTGMLIVAVLGLLVNLAAMRLLKAGSGQSLNIKGAYLEVWGDMLGSVGVIAAAVVIKLTGWTLTDPIIAVLLGLWVLPRAWLLMRQAGNVLMQGTPEGLDVEAIRQAIGSVKGVTEIHQFHVWALASTEPVLTAHVVADQALVQADTLRAQLASLLHEKFDIERVTLQIETTACD